jgi:hypothetical protein
MRHPVFYLKTRQFGDWIMSPYSGGTYSGFCLPLQVEPTQMGSVERTSLCLWTPVGFLVSSVTT